VPALPRRSYPRGVNESYPMILMRALEVYETKLILSIRDEQAHNVH